ncbi:hypothetical protein CDAR_604461 [Caerostris darwini]|uniref:Ycf15 n=1 Tax=Caerostris darwini TaxID=1538125 RepID=A0AAV4NAK5_9ARAC|nr:hypothetical protein CDAR_604461 [Caerostris darwini]
MFLWLPEYEWKIQSSGMLSDVQKRDNQSQMLVFFFRRTSFRIFTIMETIPDQPNSCPKMAGHPRGSSAENLYTAVVAKRNRSAISICVARVGFR